MKVMEVLWGKWLAIAQAVGNFQAQVFLTVFYLVILFPIAIIFKIFSDPLRSRLVKDSKKGSNFQKWEHTQESIQQARKQY